MAHQKTVGLEAAWWEGNYMSHLFDCWMIADHRILEMEVISSIYLRLYKFVYVCVCAGVQMCH